MASVFYFSNKEYEVVLRHYRVQFLFSIFLFPSKLNFSIFFLLNFRHEISKQTYLVHLLEILLKNHLKFIFIFQFFGANHFQSIIENMKFQKTMSEIK